MQPVAILDFGTNTFNLLIAEKSGDSFKTLYTGKQAVKLGKGGINKHKITGDAMERGFSAISAHMETIRKFNVADIHAYATSAFRNAENGRAFAELINKKFGFSTRIIDGDEEARLIYEGILTSVDPGDENALILDIGGGSNEFIICNRNALLWKHSFELGMARIIEKFKISDPIQATEIKELETYFRSELKLLSGKVKQYKPKILIGASGSFDTIASIAKYRYDLPASHESFLHIDLAHFADIHNTLIHSTAEERLLMPGMEPVRVEMIVPASIFINFVLIRYGLQTFIQSGFALKEGVMSELVRSNQ